MKSNPVQAFFDRIGAKVFFSLLFLYQLLLIFQGIDFNDEGSYGAFYQQIFKDPQSVQSSFVYWMSGVIGGLYLHFFSAFGLLGLRIGGVLVSMATVIIVYNLLKKHIHTSYLKLGLLIAILLFNNEPRDIFYDNITALFFVLMIRLMYDALQQRTLYKLFMCGLLLSVNTFVRLPNILGFVLGTAILYYAYLNKVKWPYLIRQILVYSAGFGIGMLMIIIIMKKTGQYDVFMNCLAVLQEMGKDKENTHNIKSLVVLFLHQYPLSVAYALEFLGIIVLFFSVVNILKQRYTILLPLRLLGVGTILLFFILIATEKFIDRWYVVTLVTGLSLVGSFFVLIKEDKQVNLLAFMGMIMTLVALFGSDTGIEVAGKYVLWIALPIATDYFCSIVCLEIESAAIQNKNNELQKTHSNFLVSESQLHSARKYTVVAIIIALLLFAIRYNWNDSLNRTKMVYSIHNPFLKGIFTTQKRADAINELLEESNRYVKKNDYVLAFDGIPLYYPMTETKPFLRNSWPQLYTKEVFREELYKAVAEKKILPIVILQKGNTLSKNWPDSTADQKNIVARSHPGDSTMKQFLEDKHYKMVWENIAFSIYVP